MIDAQRRKWIGRGSGAWSAVIPLLALQFLSGIWYMPQLSFFPIYLQETLGFAPVVIAAFVAAGQLAGHGCGVAGRRAERLAGQQVGAGAGVDLRGDCHVHFSRLATVADRVAMGDRRAGGRVSHDGRAKLRHPGGRCAQPGVGFGALRAVPDDGRRGGQPALRAGAGYAWVCGLRVDAVGACRGDLGRGGRIAAAGFG